MTTIPLNCRLRLPFLPKIACFLPSIPLLPLLPDLPSVFCAYLHSAYLAIALRPAYPSCIAYHTCTQTYSHSTCPLVHNTLHTLPARLRFFFVPVSFQRPNQAKIQSLVVKYNRQNHREQIGKIAKIPKYKISEGNLKCQGKRF